MDELQENIQDWSYAAVILAFDKELKIGFKSKKQAAVQVEVGMASILELVAGVAEFLKVFFLGTGGGSAY